MKLRQSKGIVSMVIGVFLLCSVATLAKASDLKINNNSKYTLSFSVNNVCSNEFGVVEKFSLQIIPEARFNKICKYNPNHCEVGVYTQEKCAGKQVIGLILNTTLGVQSLIVRPLIVGENEILTGSFDGFNLLFMGPWV